VAGSVNTTWGVCAGDDAGEGEWRTGCGGRRWARAAADGASVLTELAAYALSRPPRVPPLTSTYTPDYELSFHCSVRLLYAVR